MNKFLLEKAYTHIFKTEETYIQTGYSKIDSLLSKCGCSKGSLITIGGRPSMGKTTFTMNLAEQLLIRGKKCLYFSLGMSTEKFIQRLIFQNAEIPLVEIKIKDLTDNDLKKLAESKSIIEKWNLHICDGPYVDIEKINNLVKKVQPDYVFIDAIQDVWADKTTIRHFARKLKEITRNEKLNIETLNKINEIKNSLPILYEYSGDEIEKNISIEKINELTEEIDGLQYHSCFDPLREIRSENLIMDYVIKHLKIIAKKFQTVILINSQLTRATEYREHHYPRIEDLRAPKSLATISDTVMMLYREEYYNRSDEEFKKNIMEVHFLKKNYGVAELLFDPYTLKIISRPNTDMF